MSIWTQVSGTVTGCKTNHVSLKLLIIEFFEAYDIGRPMIKQTNPDHDITEFSFCFDEEGQHAAIKVSKFKEMLCLNHLGYDFEATVRFVG